MATETTDAIVETKTAAQRATAAATLVVLARRFFTATQQDSSLGHHHFREIFSVLLFVAFVAAGLRGAGPPCLRPPPIWSPPGSPSRVKPQGTEIAGRPVSVIA